MHTHINYKGACVIEVEQKCYSVISREQEAKYVERHKSNGDTLIFLFLLYTKQPILDAVNMRRGIGGKDAFNQVHYNMRRDFSRHSNVDLAKVSTNLN